MLGFFLDSQMSRPITPGSPKRFLSPLSGMTKSGTIYLGDPYTATIAEAAAIGANSLVLDDTSEFLASGQASVSGLVVSYTGISGLTLTGVSGLTAALQPGSVVVPEKQWITLAPITVFSMGNDAVTLQVALQQAGAPSFTFPGMPLILSAESLVLGATLAVGVQVTVPSGVQQEYTNWTVTTSEFYAKAVGDASPVTSATFGMSPVMNGYVNRQDQPLLQRLRLLPTNRDISTPPAGFVIGEYCWRDETEINAQAILPTNWLTDPTTLGSEKFIAGIGCDTDLEPTGFVQVNDSIYLQIDRGFYFTGPLGYYLPGTPQLDFISSLATTLQLSATPQPILPIFVGTYARDSQGFYEKSLEYRYETAAAVTRGTGLPDYYYTLNRANNTVTLNVAQSVTACYLGTISGESTDYFDLPVYPVDQVESVYVQRSDGSQLFGVNWTFDRDLGTIVITNPAGTGSSIAGALQGEMVMALCAPAVAILYETGTSETRVLDEIDLNPAFAGISGGYVYLQHSRQEAESLVLSCDKPLIDIPATYASIIGLVAYGPVYFDGDYALLQVTAYSDVPGQTVQGVDLEVIADPTTFTGTLNYMDPTAETIIVTTGADGTANLVFRPAKDYGFYIPPTAASGSLAGLKTTVVSNDTIVLPQPVPISQLHAPTEAQPYLVTLYTVENNNPLLGMVGATAAEGEVPWATSGTPGTATYKTNGDRIPLEGAGSALVYPSQMLDSNGRNYTSPQFTGNVVALVYPQTLPTGTIVGAYLVTFLQRTLLRMQAVNSNVQSNSILLQMAVPAIIDDDVWLILNDAIHGILNQYRLGWTMQATP